jgi:hypothetical protein
MSEVGWEMRNETYKKLSMREESSIEQQGVVSMERKVTRNLHILITFLHITFSLLCCDYFTFVNGFVSTTLQVRRPYIRHHHQITRTRSIRSRLFSIRNDDESSSSILLPILLHRMTVFFDSMVHPATQRFFLVCRPVTKERIHNHCPLRELGCAWDATTALQIFRSDDQQQPDTPCSSFNRLENAVQRTIDFYSAAYEDIGASSSGGGSGGIGKSLHREILQEPPNIAHSALLILTAIGAMRLSLLSDESNMVDALTQGILSMQRPDGAFKTHFGSGNIDQGIAFYPGEAMTAIMEAYVASSGESGVQQGSILKQETRDQIMPAMIKALEFYQHLYRQGQLDTNFNIWQVSAFARFVYVLNPHHDDDATKYEHSAWMTRSSAISYVRDLCRDIVASPSWRMLARGRSFYPNLATVEIACGLDAIVQGSRVLVTSPLVEDEYSKNAEDLLLFRNAIDNGVEYIHWSLDRVPNDAVVGYGGLGFGGTQVMEQRLDVTGHALAALAKMVGTPR